MRGRRGWAAGALACAGAAALVAALATQAVGAPAAARPTPGDRADASAYDPYFSQQWALTAIGAPTAWARSTGTGVKVGVVDTGVDLRHEDLAGKVVASVDCLGASQPADCGGSGQDDNGHGTSVAGIIAAATSNGRGVAGVAPGAVLVVAKALDARGSGTVGDVAAGVRWVVDHGARVVNLSVEADGTMVAGAPGPSLAEAVEYAWHHGAVPVVAAGNATPSVFGARGYAGLDAVIVGATGRTGRVAWYSGPLLGAKWGVVAPGGDARGPAGTASCAGALAAGCVVSTGWLPGRSNAYVVDEGTSMAAPAVSGVLALLMARGFSAPAAVARLMQTTDPIACGGGCAGAVDAARALGVRASAPTLGPAAVATARITAGAHSGFPRWRTEVGLSLLVALAVAWLTSGAGQSRPSRKW
jgi:serine protease